MRSTRQLTWLLVIGLVIGLATWRLVPPPEPASRATTAVPGRVVSLSPALTEVVYAIGAGDKLVGVSDFCNWPPEATLLPRCGGQINPNIEQLTRLRPDLVLFQGEHDKVREYCESMGQPWWAHRLDGLADLLALMRDLGQTLGVPLQAAAAADRLAAKLADVRAAVAGRPPVATFVCVGRQPDRIAGLTTCGPGSFVDEIVHLAGGRNVFADADTLYPQPSLEALTARRPEVIIDLQPGVAPTPANLGRIRHDWDVLPSLPAVRDHRVEVITDDSVLIPGPRVAAVAARFAQALHR